MKVFVGTSGFSYSWNPDGLEWYLIHSGLNCIELNSSFYRFPFSNYVNGWARKTKELNNKMRWIIKVNKSITHMFKFSEKAIEVWNRFYDLFKPLDNWIDFYLFQLPSLIKPSMYDKIMRFIEKINLKEKTALEFRNIEWFDKDLRKKINKIGVTIVSVDAPELPRTMFDTKHIIYERVHGRRIWYSYNYSNRELRRIANNITKTKAKKAYVLFNNNHNMLENARRMKEILSQKE